MKVILGSKNIDKIKILQKALEELHLDAEVDGIEVDSRISGQPLNRAMTKKGAVNRARNAKKKSPNADFWIGLEGGLHDYGEGYHLVTYASLVDKNDSEFMGEGEEIHLPKAVSEKVKNGEWFGDVIRDYAKTNKIDQNLITRLSPFTQAVQNAYCDYLVKSGQLNDREKSAGVVIDENNNFLIVQLNGYKENEWNFSGGGLEKGETPEETILRELSEELGTRSFKVLKKTKKNTRYDWPLYVIAKSLRENGYTYKGQEEDVFLVLFTGKKEDIKPDPGEIRHFKWIRYEEFNDHFTFPNQLELAKKAIKELLS